MNKLNKFFYIFKKSISSISYYTEVANAKFSMLFKYVLLFSILFGIVYNIIFANFYVQVSKNWPNVYTDIKAGLYQIYPKDLVVTVTDGVLSTNMPNPVLIKIPSNFVKIVTDLDPELKKDATFVEMAKEYNLAVIDTTAKVEDISKYKTVILFTKDSFATISKNSKENNLAYEFHNYEKDNKITKLNSSVVNMGLNEGVKAVDSKVIPAIKAIALTFLFSLWIILGLVLLVGTLISHVITSIVGLIISKIMSANYSYSQIYKVGMLLIPLYWIIGLINFFVAIPAVFLIKCTIYIVVICLACSKSKQAQPKVEVVSTK